jgi:predicted lipoprotein with Yx(FWY)xxD motif
VKLNRAASLGIAASALVALTGIAVPAAAGTVTADAKTPVSTRHTALGTFLIDSKGRTLYLFQKDRKNVSRCSRACATSWPPALAPGGVVAKGAVRQNLLGRIHRADGTWQITYNGHPLYRFSGDTKPGQTRGQGLNAFGAQWYVIAPNGNKIDND